MWAPPLFPKQFDLLRACREPDGLRKYVLVNGPRWASKSWAALHAICDHAWNVNNGSVCVLCPSIPAGSSSGIWTLLTEQVIPLWIAADFGFKWASLQKQGRWKDELGKPRQDGASKKIYCVVTNKWGGTTRIELNSLKDERDTETEFKNRYFSMIYWSELSNFKKPATFNTLIHALRVPGVAEGDHLMLCDTNPAEEGEDHWAWKMWYWLRTARPEELEEDQRPFQKHLRLIEFTLDDNLSLNEDRKKEILASFAHDPDLKARYGYGKWVKASSDALFFGVFRPNIHIIGNVNDEDPEVLLPEPDVSELHTGWDPGGANPAMVIAEKVHRTVERPEGRQTPADAARAAHGLPPRVEQQEESVFKFIDELAFVRDALSISDFTELVMGRIDYWQRFVGRKLIWYHWSDSSAFDHREPISNRYIYEEVYAASGGEIALQRVEKGDGSIARAVRLWRRLLYQERMYFSAGYTPKLIEMNRSLKRNKSEKAPIDSVAKGQDLRHIFDAARYLVMMECWGELQDGIITLQSQKLPEGKLLYAA